MNGFEGVPTDRLLRAARAQGHKPARPNGTNGIGDYNDAAHIDAIQPATSMPLPPGPADFPVQLGPATQDCAVRTCDLLQRILDQLILQNSSATPVLRSKDVDDVGETLDWSQFGLFDRLMIRNAGTSIVYLAFDMNGPNVDAFTSDLSFMLQANESLNLTHCKFRKVGLRCAAAGTATVNAVAFQSLAGNLNGSIS